MTRPPPRRGWRFAIDRGGTFTDIVARDPDGRLHTHKVLSRDPSHPGDPAIRGIGEVLPAWRARRIRAPRDYGGDQRIARAQGRTDAARDDARLARRAADRATAPPGHLRASDPAAAHAVRAGDRSARTHRFGRAGARAARRAGAGRGARRRATSRPARSGDRVPARGSQPGARATRGGPGGRGRLRRNRHVPRGGADHRTRPARRQRRRRCLPVAGAVALGRCVPQRTGRAARRATALDDAEQRRPRGPARFPRHQWRPLRAGGRCRGTRGHRPGERPGATDRFRHGRHFH